MKERRLSKIQTLVFTPKQMTWGQSKPQC